MELLISIAALLVTLAFLARCIPVSLLSPVYTLITTYLIIIVAGAFIYDPNYGGGGAKFFLVEEESHLMCARVIWLLCAFSAGAVLYVSRMRTHRGKRKLDRQTIYRMLGVTAPIHGLTKPQSYMSLFFGISILLLVIGGTGWAGVFSRSEYILETNHVVRIMGNALLPLGIIALGAASTSVKASLRVGAIIAGIGSLVLTLALSTRIFCLVPALFLVGMLIVRKDSKWLKACFTLSVIVAPFSILVPLLSRGMPTQGLLAIPDLLYELSHIDLSSELHEVLNNLFISAPITIESMRANVGDNLHYIAIGVNPLPSFMTDWAESQRRFNGNTPFNALGDLLRGGLPIAMGYFVAIGIYFARVDRKLRTIQKPSASLMALMALSYLFIITTLQYPLRNCTRLVYYMIGIEFFFLIVRNLRRRSKFSRRLESLKAASSMGDVVSTQH